MKLSRFRVSERQALQLVMIACAVGVASAFLVVFLRRQVRRMDLPRRAPIRWISPRTLDRRNDPRAVIAELEDPSLMSLPHPRAFSATWWQRHAQMDTTPVQLSNTVAYLDAPHSPPLEPLIAVEPLPAAVRKAATKPEPALDEPRPVATAPSPGRSTLQFDAPLASFELLHLPSLPVIASETALRPTVVRLGVAPDGTVVHGLLERSCGNESADAVALDAARQIRFARSASAPSGGLLWGNARFLWATTSR